MGDKSTDACLCNELQRSVYSARLPQRTRGARDSSALFAFMASNPTVCTDDLRFDHAAQVAHNYLLAGHGREAIDILSNTLIACFDAGVASSSRKRAHLLGVPSGASRVSNSRRANRFPSTPPTRLSSTSLSPGSILLTPLSHPCTVTSPTACDVDEHRQSVIPSALVPTEVAPMTKISEHSALQSSAATSLTSALQPKCAFLNATSSTFGSDMNTPNNVKPSRPNSSVRDAATSPVSEPRNPFRTLLDVHRRFTALTSAKPNHDMQSKREGGKTDASTMACVTAAACVSTAACMGVAACAAAATAVGSGVAKIAVSFAVAQKSANTSRSLAPPKRRKVNSRALGNQLRVKRSRSGAARSTGKAAPKSHTNGSHPSARAEDTGTAPTRCTSRANGTESGAVSSLPIPEDTERPATAVSGVNKVIVRNVPRLSRMGPAKARHSRRKLLAKPRRARGWISLEPLRLPTVPRRSQVNTTERLTKGEMLLKDIRIRGLQVPQPSTRLESAHSVHAVSARSFLSIPRSGKPESRPLPNSTS